MVAGSVVPMTIEQVESQHSDVPQVSYSVEDTNAMPDVVLRALVGLVNDFKDLGMGVTLYVSGTIVSGILISYESYWESFRVFVRENGSPESQAVREAFADAFTATFVGAGHDGNAEPVADEDDEAAPPPHYIHLRDAVVWAPGVDPTLPKTLWRGRLSHVSAWSIGTFGS